MIKEAVTVFVLSLFAITAFGQCVFNTTHCTCASNPGGGVCLSYNSGSGASTMCDVYTCREGLRCDCGGTDICEMQTCDPRDKYVPREAIPGGTGTTTPVMCEVVTTTTCLAVDQPTPTPSPTPSTSPPLTGFLEQCGAGSSCPTPLTCDCGNTCSVEVTLTISIMADNGHAIYTCSGNNIGSGNNRETLYTYPYTGHCDEWIVVVHNQGGSHAGMGLSVEVSGSRYGSGNDFDMLVALNPTGGYLETETYDYSSWVTAVENPGLYPTNNNMNAFRGTPWNAQSMAYPGIAQYSTTDVLVYKITPIWCPGV